MLFHLFEWDGTGVFLSSYLGGSGATCYFRSDQPRGQLRDGVLRTYIGGSTTSTIFPPESAFQRVSGRGRPHRDGFFARFSNVSWAALISGLAQNQKSGHGIAFQGTACYLVGGTISSNFPVIPVPSSSVLRRTSGQDTNDAFVAKAIGGCTLNGTDKSVTLCRPSSGATVSSPRVIEAGTIDNFQSRQTDADLRDHVKATSDLSALLCAHSDVARNASVSVQAVMLP